MADTLMRPTWRNMNSSFEEWSYRNGFLRQIQTLEAQGWLESREGSDGTERVYRLTRKGHLRALGGSHPVEQWNRGWDGKWRVVVFDLPEEKRSLRNELRKQLRAAGFGGLQGSVWISPDHVELVSDRLRKTAVSCGVLTFFEGATCCGENRFRTGRLRMGFRQDSRKPRNLSRSPEVHSRSRRCQSRRSSARVGADRETPLVGLHRLRSTPAKRTLAGGLLRRESLEGTNPGSSPGREIGLLMRYGLLMRPHQ